MSSRCAVSPRIAAVARVQHAQPRIFKKLFPLGLVFLFGACTRWCAPASSSPSCPSTKPPLSKPFLSLSLSLSLARGRTRSLSNAVTYVSSYDYIVSLSLSNPVTYVSSYDQLYTLRDRKLILACTCYYCVVLVHA